MSDIDCTCQTYTPHVLSLIAKIYEASTILSLFYRQAKAQEVHIANQREFEKTKPFHVYNGQEQTQYARCTFNFCLTKGSPSSQNPL